MMAAVQLRGPGYDRGGARDSNPASCLGRMAAVARGPGETAPWVWRRCIAGQFSSSPPRLKIRWPGWKGAIVMVGFCSGEKSGGKN